MQKELDLIGELDCVASGHTLAGLSASRSRVEPRHYGDRQNERGVSERRRAQMMVRHRILPFG
jgi:hypothetical protein